MPARVLLVDHQPIFAEAIRSLLASQQDVEVVGEARGDAAIGLVHDLSPDVVVVIFRCRS